MKSEKKPAAHLDAIDSRVAVVEKTICEQMYVDTIEEALELAQSRLRHEGHMTTLNDERAELAFLKLRREAIVAKIAAVPA